MDNEANKRIHALLGGCWHEMAEVVDSGLDTSGRMQYRYGCRGCSTLDVDPQNPVPDYFSETLPDNLRVAMVRAASERFGHIEVIKAISSGQYTVLNAPAPAIAEAIDRLITANEQ